MRNEARAGCACCRRRAGDFAQLPRSALVRFVFDRADAGSLCPIAALQPGLRLICSSKSQRRAGADATLDVLQSVPILSFLPVVILSFSAVLPQSLAAELAAIVLIFTSQAWNMTFSFYQSMTMIPTSNAKPQRSSG